MILCACVFVVVVAVCVCVGGGVVLNGGFNFLFVMLEQFWSCMQ
jgi:hypothetical protein